MKIPTSWLQNGWESGFRLGFRVAYRQGATQRTTQIVQRLLLRRLGPATDAEMPRIQELQVEQLEQLAVEALDFKELRDLADWLKSQKANPLKAVPITIPEVSQTWDQWFLSNPKRRTERTETAENIPPEFREGASKFVNRILLSLFGRDAIPHLWRVKELSSERLAILGDDLLNFSELSDLVHWLDINDSTMNGT